MQDKTTLAKKTAGSDRSQAVSADLIAVVIAVTNGEPRVLTIGQTNALPSGPFELDHRSLQSGLRAWVERQTSHPLGYIEQLYTFADRDRTRDERVQRVISISYLGLTREEQTERSPTHGWHRWYDYFPWEDHRAGVPSILPDILVPRLQAWADEADDPDMRHDRRQRVAIAFGFGERDWNEELVLQRYELLYEAALVAEARPSWNAGSAPSIPGRTMIGDHRRILATGIARLRTKIKYRPVVFELMSPVFTLLQLQRTVEALAGRLVHKQNFRRLIEQQDLVEETGETMSGTGGRPAKRFRFRQTVLAERTVAGTKLPLSRA
ncbi:NrtR DNA-binding winged helix domain-containing protein [Mesorhizobium sp. IMUNJ 23232]|uniref:NUDIX hydrolase n=1 Tax=Mesorhizobium sp. IMUNJ 23232 TaxID=3376064 RepID=UPI0037A60EDD